MQKLRLNLDSIAVESFNVQPTERGNVHSNEGTRQTCYTCYTCDALTCPEWCIL